MDINEYTEIDFSDPPEVAIAKGELVALIALAEQARSMWEDGSWDKPTVRKALDELDSKAG